MRQALEIALLTGIILWVINNVLPLKYKSYLI